MKRELWNNIQQKAPDLAKFLQDVAKTFGKPASVQVRLK